MKTRIFAIITTLFFSAIGRAYPEEPDDFTLEEATIEQIHQAFESGELTCKQLTKKYIKQILNFDLASSESAPPINSVLTINPDALRRAKELDKEYKKNGLTGPLHCIPCLLKDNFNTYDMRTTGASKTLATSVPGADAFAVERMREAGAIILGKANMDEFAASVTGTSGFRQVANPYNTFHSSGGSSSGSGAAIASNFAVLGTGTDTCQSIRLPASYNSLVSMRPSVGLVSQSGIIPLSNFADVGGPMARTVSDMATLLGVMAGEDPADYKTSDPSLNRPDNYTDFLSENGLSGKRIGILRTYRGIDGNGISITKNAFGEDEETIAIVEQAINDMESAGAIIVDDIHLPDSSDITELMFYLLLVNVPELFDSYLNSVDAGFDFEQMLANGQLGVGAQGLLDLTLLPLYANFTDLEGLETSTRQERHHYEAVMDALNLDVLVYPSAPNGPPPLIADLSNINTDTNCHLSSTTGMPAMVIPAGFNSDHLPIGLEMLARKWAEPTLIEVGYAYEQLTHHRQPPTLPTKKLKPKLTIEEFNDLITPQ